jgi:hypothetical protein
LSVFATVGLCSSFSHRCFLWLQRSGLLAALFLLSELIVLRFKRTGGRLAADTACPFIAYTSTRQTFLSMG